MPLNINLPIEFEEGDPEHVEAHDAANAALNAAGAVVDGLSTRAAKLERGVADPVTLDYAPSIIINASQGSLFRLVATGNLAITSLVEGANGQTVTVRVLALNGDRTLIVLGKSETIPTGTWWTGRFTFDQFTNTWARDFGQVIADHGGLAGLGDDDHPQYLTQERADARYYTETQIDTALAGKASVTHAHDSGSSSSTASFTTLRYSRGINASGAESTADAAHLPGVYGTDYSYPSAAEFAAWAARGHELVRIPARAERLFLTRSGTWRDAERLRLRQAVADARAAGIARILIDPMHNYARWINPTASGGATLILGQGWSVADYVACWVAISTEFRDQPDVEYDLMNGPHTLAAVAGAFTGTVRYNWASGIQGWTGGDTATASNNAGQVQFVAAVSAGTVTFRRDDAGAVSGGSAITGNALRAKVTISSTSTSATAWTGHLEWQDASPAWQTPTSTTYVRVSDGVVVSGLVPDVPTYVTSTFSSIDSPPTTLALQIDGIGVAAGSLIVLMDDFAQGTLAGAQTEGQVWEDITRQAAIAIRGNGDSSHIRIPSYGLSGAQVFTTHHTGGPWWEDDSADNHSYQVRYYPDSDHSGSFAYSYATENAAAVTDGHDSLAAKAATELTPFAQWCRTYGVKGYLGETGWPNTGDTTGWNTVGEAIYDLADTYRLDITYWVAGARLGTSYLLSLYTGTVQDVVKSQATVVEAHPTVALSLVSTLDDLDTRITAVETDGGGGGGGGPTTAAGPAGGVLSGNYPNPGFASSPTFTGVVRAPRFVGGAVTVPYAASITLNALQGETFRVVATGDLLLDDITGGIDNQTIALEVVASGGDRTVSVTGAAFSPEVIPSGERWTRSFRYHSDDGSWWLLPAGGGGSSDGSSGVPTDGSVTNASVAANAAIVLSKTADSTASTGRLAMTNAERTKLTGIAAGATANATDAQLRDRATHTGLQSADSLTDGSTNRLFSTTEKTKLAGIAIGATVNVTDAQLRDRATHTGTQAISTVSGLQAALDGKVTAATTGAKLWIGTQAAYDAITTKDATTLYAITG